MDNTKLHKAQSLQSEIASVKQNLKYFTSTYPVDSKGKVVEHYLRRERISVFFKHNDSYRSEDKMVFNPFKFINDDDFDAIIKLTRSIVEEKLKTLEVEYKNL